MDAGEYVCMYIAEKLFLAWLVVLKMNLNKPTKNNVNAESQRQRGKGKREEKNVSIFVRGNALHLNYVSFVFCGNFIALSPFWLHEMRMKRKEPERWKSFLVVSIECAKEIKYFVRITVFLVVESIFGCIFISWTLFNFCIFVLASGLVAISS